MQIVDTEIATDLLNILYSRTWPNKGNLPFSFPAKIITRPDPPEKAIRRLSGTIL
jgi:hypothetical protein